MLVDFIVISIKDIEESLSFFIVVCSEGSVGVGET